MIECPQSPTLPFASVVMKGSFVPSGARYRRTAPRSLADIAVGKS
jgi:hypothetical protein